MGTQSKTSQNQTQTSTPDPLTDAWRNQVFNMGSSMVGQSTPQQQVAPKSPFTQIGEMGAGQYAMNGIPGLDAANSANTRAMSGFNPAMPMAANAAFGGLAGNPATQGLQQFGGGQNPFLKSMFDQGAGDISNAVNANFANAGRFGPNAAHTGTMTRELGNLWSNINMPAYESERDRGLAAQQTMGSLYDSGANRTLAGIGMFGDMHNAGVDQADRAIGNVPGLFAAGAMPFELLSQVGANQDAYNQSIYDAQTANENAPWQRLLDWGNLASGMPVFGTNVSNGTTKTRGNSIGWSYQNGLTLG